MTGPFCFPVALRETGVVLVGGLAVGRELYGALRSAGIPVYLARDAFWALDEVRRRPGALVVCFDFGKLDASQRLAAGLRELKGPSGESPGLVVIAEAIEEGISQAGWTDSLSRVGFVRRQSLASDFCLATGELLGVPGGQPEAWVDVPAADAAVAPIEREPLDPDKLAGELETLLAWTAPQIERVGDQLEARCELHEVGGLVGDALEGSLFVAWRDAEGERFQVSLSAEVPPGAGFELERAEGFFGVLGRWLGARPVGIEALEGRFVLRAEASGREAARAVEAELASFAGDVMACRVADGILDVCCDEVSSVDVLRVADQAVKLWRALTLARLRAPVPA